MDTTSKLALKVMRGDNQLLSKVTYISLKTGNKIVGIREAACGLGWPIELADVAARRLVQKGYLRSASDQGGAYIVEGAGLRQVEAVAEKRNPFWRFAKTVPEALLLVGKALTEIMKLISIK